MLMDSTKCKSSFHLCIFASRSGNRCRAKARIGRSRSSCRRTFSKSPPGSLLSYFREKKQKVEDIKRNIRDAILVRSQISLSYFYECCDRLVAVHIET